MPSQKPSALYRSRSSGGSRKASSSSTCVASKTSRHSSCSLGASRCRAEAMIVATAGHIDHGKTALVKALTGVDTDRLPEEKARGISIDLGFAYWRTPSGQTVGFVDVPGHERFVR